MLNYIRNNIQSFVVKIIVSGIVVVMLFFGVNSFESQSINVLATVGDHDVSVAEYQRAYSSAEREYFARYKEQARMVIEQTNLNKQVLSRLISSALLVENAKHNGIKATELEIAAAIRNQPELHTEGRFDKTKYFAVLENNRISATDYEKDLSNKIITAKYYDLVASGQSVSKAYVARTYIRDETEFKVQVLELDLKKYQVKVSATEKEIQNFYEENKASYTVPKEFQVKFFTLDAADEMSKVSVRPKELEKYYQRNKENFVIKTAYRTRHILLEVPQGAKSAKVRAIQKKAERLANQVRKKPSTFAAAAKKHSQDPGSAAQGGEIGWKPEGALVPSYEAAMAKMKKGQISKPVQSRFGFHIIQLEGKIQGHELTFEEAKDKIKKEIAFKKAKRRLKNQVAKLEKELAGGIAQLSQNVNATVQESQSFGPRGTLPKVASTLKLYQALLNQQIGDKGTLLLNEGSLAIVYELVAIKEQRVQAISEVNQQVKQGVEAQLTRLRSTEKMLTAAKGITTVSKMKRAASAQNRQIKQATFLYKDATIPNMDTTREFQSQVLSLQPGEVRVIIDQEKAFIVKLVKKTAGKFEKEEKLTSLENYLKQKKAELILQNLMNDFSKTIEVVYNQKVMDAYQL